MFLTLMLHEISIHGNLGMDQAPICVSTALGMYHSIKGFNQPQGIIQPINQ